MNLDVQLAIGSVGAGAAYGLIGAGLVGIYRGAATINFSMGAMAAVGAFMADDLHDGGAGWPLLPSVLVAVLTVALLGAAFELVVMRFLRSAGLLKRIVGTLGLLVAAQGFILLFFDAGTKPQVVLFESGVWDLPFGYTVARDRLLIFVTSVVLVSLLGLLYRYTTFGISTRAISEDPDSVSLSGRNPDLIAAANWAIGGALAGFAGILLSGILTADARTFTLIILFALAAAALGRFQSLSLALAGGLIIAAGQSVLTYRAPQLRDWTGLVGWSSSFPFVVLLVVVVVFGSALPSRGFVSEMAPPAAPLGKPPLRTGLVVAAVGAVCMMIIPDSGVNPLTTTLIMGIVCLSLVVVTGFVGQLSLAQMAFAGLGALFGSWLVNTVGAPFPLTLVLAAAMVFPIGVVIGLVSVRSRGVTLGIVSLGVALSLDAMLFTDTRIVDYYGMQLGTATLGPLNFDSFRHPRSFGLMVVVVLAVLAAGTAWLRRSVLGQRFLAVRVNESGAESVGISVPAVKVLAFSMAASIAAVAGVLMGYQSGRASPTQFATMGSITILVAAMLGGLGTVGGAAIGGVAASAGIGSYLMVQLDASPVVIDVVGGLSVFYILVLHPDGLAQFWWHLVKKIPVPFRRSSSPDDDLGPEIRGEVAVSADGVR